MKLNQLTKNKLQTESDHEKIKTFSHLRQTDNSFMEQ